MHTIPAHTVRPPSRPRDPVLDLIQDLGWHAVLPSQLARYERANDTPERRLMVAVLDDAWMCAVRTPDPGTKDTPWMAERRDAREWFASDDRSHLFAFRNVCDVLDCDAEAIRALITTGTHPRDLVTEIAGQPAADFAKAVQSAYGYSDGTMASLCGIWAKPESWRRLLAGQIPMRRGTADQLLRMFAERPQR